MIAGAVFFLMLRGMFAFIADIHAVFYRKDRGIHEPPEGWEEWNENASKKRVY